MLKNIQSTQANIIYSNNLKVKNNLEKIRKIQIRKKIGQNQQIFGRITENEVIEKIVELTGLRLNKKQFKIPNIKEIGMYNISIKIQENINCIVQLQIVPSIL